VARALILGAGFGGIATAVALREQLPSTDEVVLVDRRDDFAMGLRKIWAILGISPIAYGTRPLAMLERRGIRVVHADVTGIAPASRIVNLGGTTLEADALVLALGASHAIEAIPGLGAHGVNAWERAGVDHAHALVDGFRGGRVVVGIFGSPYSCPPAPFELAILLAERFAARGTQAEVSVFGPAPIPLPILGVDGCAPILARLDEVGVAYLGGRMASRVTDRSVEFSVAQPPLAFDLLLAVPPHRVPALLVDAGLAAADGWLRVDRATLETNVTGVYGIGDCTGIGLANGMPLPKAGTFAEREGETVAARIAAAFRGDPPSATFDGRGACYMEMGDGEASVIGGDMYADPPDVTLSVPSAPQRAGKEQFEMERLARWFDR